eukprot:scaffold53038_cov40-Phaeocystis_antarctica.AAC.1
MSQSRASRCAIVTCSDGRRMARTSRCSSLLPSRRASAATCMCTTCHGSTFRFRPPPPSPPSSSSSSSSSSASAAASSLSRARSSLAPLRAAVRASVAVAPSARSEVGEKPVFLRPASSSVPRRAGAGGSVGLTPCGVSAKAMKRRAASPHCRRSRSSRASYRRRPSSPGSPCSRGLTEAHTSCHSASAAPFASSSSSCGAFRRRSTSAATSLASQSAVRLAVSTGASGAAARSHASLAAERAAAAA